MYAWIVQYSSNSVSFVGEAVLLVAAVVVADDSVFCVGVDMMIPNLDDALVSETS